MLRLTSRLAGAALALLTAACGGGGGGGGAPVSPLWVASTEPAEGAQGVEVDALVRVVFSLPLDPASVNAQSVRVGVAGGGGEISGTVTIDASSGGTAIDFAPSQTFTPGVSHVIVVSQGIRSASGDALGGTRNFFFWTTSAGGGGVPLPQPSQLRATNGKLQQGRRLHAATLLLDGRVLMTGGFIQDTIVTDRAEIFSPWTETFTTTSGRMAQPRAGHTATVLGNGKVLLAGGWYEVSAGTLNSSYTAEIYEPSTGTFRAVDDMRQPRVDAAALRLPDGRVLVTGGSKLEGAFLTDLADSEVFDPSTETWSDWPNAMVHTHATHGMHDLGDGRWLIAGGSDSDLRAEVFDVAAGTFSPVASPTGDQGRFGAATELFADGDAAVVGGEDQGTVLHFDRPTATMLNTGSGTSLPRAYGTATRIASDQILVAGGVDWSNGGFVLATCDLLKQGGVAGSQTYSTAVRFPTGMANHTATRLLDGKVLFAGGATTVAGASELDGAYLFTP